MPQALTDSLMKTQHSHRSTTDIEVNKFLPKSQFFHTQTHAVERKMRMGMITFDYTNPILVPGFSAL